MLDPAREPICGEGYGPGGAVVIVTCRDPGRSPGEDELRSAFIAEGGRRGAVGSVAYLFRPVGVLRYAEGKAVREQGGAAGVEEMLAAGQAVDFITDPGERDAIERMLGKRGFRCVARGGGWRAMEVVTLSSQQRARLADLVSRLSAIDGVGHVYSNAQNTDELLAPV
jgi:transcriptional/translational regulatory protein YebC/TACO1